MENHSALLTFWVRRALWPCGSLEKEHGAAGISIVVRSVGCTDSHTYTYTYIVQTDFGITACCAEQEELTTSRSSLICGNKHPHFSLKISIRLYCVHVLFSIPSVLSVSEIRAPAGRCRIHLSLTITTVLWELSLTSRTGRLAYGRYGRHGRRGWGKDLLLCVRTKNLEYISANINQLTFLLDMCWAVASLRDSKLITRLFKRCLREVSLQRLLMCFQLSWTLW